MSVDDLLRRAAVILAGYRLRKDGDDKEAAAARQWLEEKADTERLAWLDGATSPEQFADIAARALAPPGAEAPSAPGVDLDKLDRGGRALILERAWRRVREGATNGEAAPLYLSALMRVTRTVLVDALAARASSGTTSPPPLTLDRDTLRLYFANLLLSEDGDLAASYLNPPPPGRPSTSVPISVASEFRLQLARFMLSAVLILERRNAIDVGQPPAVTGAEIVDSLLYLVDRYVHVELGVDERLRVREHLASGFTAEVELHLAKPFYRDHLLHVIDVFLLGHFLLRTRVSLIDGGEPRELLLELLELERLHPPQGVQPDDARLTPEAWLRDWAVAALLHDLGYQMTPATSPDVDAKRLARYFKLPGAARPSWLGVDPVVRWDAFLERLEQRLREADDGYDAWLPVPGSFDFTDHGVLSALRLAQVMVHAGSAEAPAGQADWTLLREYRRALHASAHHNLFGTTVRLQNDPMACLLRLCDELQEWNRRRVNIEKSLKGLYLQIETGDGGVDGHECLRALELNVAVEPESPGARAANGRRKPLPHDGLQVTLSSTSPAATRGSGAEPADEGVRFEFKLLYNDSSVADFEPTTTFLHKAYGLQHIDLCARAGGRDVALHWRIELVFPRPTEYGSFGEIDLYTLFTDQQRELPRLRTWENPGAGPGLWSLPDNGQRVDRVAIILAPAPPAGARGPGVESGAHLRIAPRVIFTAFVEFKKAQLAQRRQQRASAAHGTKL